MPEIEILRNGITLIVEQMPYVESVAYELHIPGGLVMDRENRIGSSLILAELTSRGAGALDSRALSDAFDARGIRHGESAGMDRYFYRGLCLGPELPHALELVGAMVAAPHLPEDEIASIQSVLLQDIASLPDDPARYAMKELAARYFPQPYARPGHGTKEGISATIRDDLLEQWSTLFHPHGAILSIAGQVDPMVARHLGESLFDQKPSAHITRTFPEFGALPPLSRTHIPSDGAQVQIVLAYPSARFDDPDYYVAKIATAILSGGMFGRLFIEVREKRGLCYSIFARHAANTDYGQILAYAGTTTERARETLEVMVGELDRLRGSIRDDELERARTNLLTNLIMGEESTASRAAGNASDWWQIDRIRSLDEITEAVHRVSREDIDRYLDRFPAHPYALLTLGASDITGTLP